MRRLIDAPNSDILDVHAYIRFTRAPPMEIARERLGRRIRRVVGTESEGVTREQAKRTIEGLRAKAREGGLDLPAGRKVHRTFAEA